MPDLPLRCLTALASLTLVAAVAVPAGARTVPRPAPAPGAGATVDVVVRPAPGLAAQSVGANAARAARAATGGGPADLRAVHQRSGVAVVAVPADRAEAAMAALAGNPDVGEVELDPVVEVFDDVGTGAPVDRAAPDDTRYSRQWALPRVEAPGAWAHTVGTESVRVAVIDTGVDADHEDLEVVDGINVSGEGALTDHADRNGHGTHVAGVAAATTNNATGVAGACWDCSVLSVKALEDSGAGTQSRVAEGIHWSIEAGADVIVMSLGGEGSSHTLQRAVAAAADADVLMVAAAGNRATDMEFHPAAYEEVVGVAALDEADERASFSNHGDWVELAAPGVRIDSTMSSPNSMGCTGGYCQLSGTSMAAPVVAGVGALARSLAPQPSAADIRAAMSTGAIDVGAWLVGGGLDAAATMDALVDDDLLPDDGDGPEDDEADDDYDDGTDHDDDSDDDGSDDGGSDDEGSDDDGSDSDDDGDGTERRSSLESGISRTAGTQRFATAARLSSETFAPGVDRVYLATGTDFADALAAGAAAGAAHGPVLLAAATVLPDDTAEELRRLEPDEVVVVGGTGAIGDEVRTAAERAAGAPSRRLAGSERFATAAQIALDSFAPGGDLAYVATGNDFADALAGVPAAVVDGAPMLLTSAERLPEATRTALETLQPDRIITLGGTGAVSASVQDELGGLAGTGGVARLAGDTRFATASAVAARFDEAPGSFLATGGDFPDALAGGPVAGHHASPLLLVTGKDTPAVTRAQLERLAPRHLRLLGGSQTLSDELFDKLRLLHQR